MAWITEPMYYLSYEQALNNAEIVFATFNSSGLGFTKETICGILGNMWRESHVNPNMSEEGGGTTPAGAGAGLVQWTPATELTKHMQSGDRWNDGDFQMRVLIQELSPANVNNGGSSYGQWYDTGQWTYASFVTSTDVAWSTECFMRCYERPGVLELAERIEYALKFYADLTGEVPSGDGTQLAVLPVRSGRGYGDVYLTQAEGGDFSHYGTLAMDFAYSGHTEVPYYAPFDMTIVEQGVSAAYNIWQSDRPVKCADGSVSPVYFVAIHDNHITDFSVGDKRKKGQEMGRSGEGGNAFGDHCHFEAVKGTYDGNAWYTNPEGRVSLRNPEHMYNVFSVCDNVGKEEITIVNQTGLNLPWVCILNWDDGEGGSPDPDSPKDNLIELLLCDCLNGWKW